MSTQMYVDLVTLKIISRVEVLRRGKSAKAKGVPLTQDDLTRGTAALLLETATGDVATGKAVYDATIPGYVREFRAHKDTELYAQAKQARAEQVEQITVTTASGKVFDGHEEAQNRMARVVAVGASGMSTKWKLADNTWTDVTWDELKEALLLAGQAQTDVWNI